MTLACLLPVPAAAGTEMNLTAPSFPGARIFVWRIDMEINNYRTRVALQQRCLRLEDNQAREKGAGEALWGRSQLTWFGATAGRAEWIERCVSAVPSVVSESLQPQGP